MEENKEEQEQKVGEEKEVQKKEIREIKEEHKPIKIAEPIKRQEQKPRVPINMSEIAKAISEHAQKPKGF